MKPLIVAVALSVLGACGSPGRVPPRAMVDFGPPVPAQATSPLRPGVGLDVRLPAWIDTPAMSYRLLYANPAQLHEYAETRWAAAPAALVGQRLRQRLRLPSTAGQACKIVVALDEFGQSFDSPEKGRGVLQGQATLSDRRGVVLARIALSFDALAATADARGGVLALAEVVDRSALALEAWLGEPERRTSLQGCGG